MAKSKKQKGFIRSKEKETIKEKVYELQNGKSIDDLKNSIAQMPYALVINLIPQARTISNEALTFGNLMLKRDKEKNISEFNTGIIGLNLTKNERIMLNVLATLISNSTFQVDIKSKNVELSKVSFKFNKKIIRELSSIDDCKTIISVLSRPFIFKTNNRGGAYIVDRLFNCKVDGNFYSFRFSRYLAYDYKHPSEKGYAKRRGFYNKKRHTIYETLFLELLFAKTAVFKDKKAPKTFEVQIKTLLNAIKLYNMMHEHKPRAVALLNEFIKASFEFGVFVGEPYVFDATTFDRNSKNKLSFTINPDFDWTNCDWDKWNIKKG